MFAAIPHPTLKTRSVATAFSAKNEVHTNIAWLSPVERTVRVREVPSSNLGAPTWRKPPNLGGFFISYHIQRLKSPMV